MAIDTNGWLTRNQAMDLLGCSMATLYRWERVKQLRRSVAVREGREVIVYHPEDLARLPRRSKAAETHWTEGELEARTFELLDAGKTIREIVIRLRETTAKIQDLREAWLDAGGARRVLSDDTCAELARFVGPFETVDDLVARVREMCGRTIEINDDTQVPETASDAQIERAIGDSLDHDPGHDKDMVTP